MKIDIPDDWRPQFEAFDTASDILRNRFQSESGVSRETIIKCFAAIAGVRSIWRDPAFLVWAGSRRITTAGDLFDYWERLTTDEAAAPAAKSKRRATTASAVVS